MKLSRSNRRGTSLIEVIIALSIGVSVLSSATLLLHRMFFQQQIATADANFHIATGNLAHRFRSDVHACLKCTVTDDGNGLELSGASGTTTYRVEPEHPHVVRRESQHENGPQTDSFSLVASSAASFETESFENGAVARLLLRLPDPTLPATSSPRTESEDASALPTLQIEAAFQPGG